MLQRRGLCRAALVFTTQKNFSYREISGQKKPVREAPVDHVLLGCLSSQLGVVSGVSAPAACATRAVAASALIAVSRRAARRLAPPAVAGAAFAAAGQGAAIL